MRSMLPLRASLKPLAFGAFALVISMTGAVSPSSATTADLRGGFYTDMGGVALGGGLMMGFSSDDHWQFNPNIEAAFADGVNVVTFNADFQYAFSGNGSVVPYLGVGPALLFTNPDGGGSDTNVGANFIGGISGYSGAVRPFVQLKGIVGDNSELALMGGIRF